MQLQLLLKEMLIGDGVVTLDDLELIRSYLANYNYNTGESTVEVKPGADFNGDGVINSLDVTQLREYLE